MLPARVRLGIFDLDLRAGELCAPDRTTRLQQQSFQILLLLIERAGEIVTRDEIQKKLWPNDTVVEFDHSINSAIKKLRQALADSADEPKYVETVARRGYRLLMPVERFRAAQDDSAALPSLRPAQGVQTEHPNPNEDNQLHASAGAAGLIGKKVSHYRVLEVIGGGGMGLVYKAEDLKLGRQVAVKFLPEELAWEPAALRRFEREARYASSLNHPNICTIYEIEEYEGQPFLVMELLEGQTLRDRLAAREAHTTLSHEELLDIGIQVSAGLEAAHEKGIIHRDIKPANIFICRRGACKILDFGVATLVNAAKRSGSDSAQIGPEGVAHEPSPHDTTMAKTGLGTAGYMSPEQVRGEKLDARTDIFSFGLVLYELATGERAFSGETQVILRDAILNREPKPMRELAPEQSLGLSTIIDRCLEKQRERRYQTATEVRLDLEKEQRGTGHKGARRSLAPWAAAAGLLVLAALLIGLYLRRSSPVGRLGASSSSLQVLPLTESGKSERVAATPDGRYIAYVKLDADSYELRLLQVATDRDVQLLPGAPQRIHNLHFSRDGNFLYFLRVLDPAKDPYTSGVFRIGTLGGPVTTLAIDARTIAERANSVTVSPDGKQIAYIAQTASDSLIVAIDADGSNRRVLARRPLGLDFWFVEWSPSQDTLAAVANVKDDMVLFRVDLPTGSMQNLSGPGWTIGQPAWSADGATIFAPALPSNGDPIMQIWAFDARTGAHRALTSSSTWYSQWSLSATANDDLVANSVAVETALSVTDQSGQPYPLPALRGEGSEAVVWVDSRIVTGNMNGMVVHDPDRSNPTKLRTYSTLYRQLARCGPGNVVYWAVDAKRHSHIARTDIATGSSSALTDGPIDTQPTCTADGSTLVFTRCSEKGDHCALTRKSLDSGQSLELYQFDPAADVSEVPSPGVSPDGKSVLFWRYTHAEDSYEWAAIIPIGGGEVRKVRMPVPASQFGAFGAFRWAADGKSILYARNENGIGNIWSVPLAGDAPRRITNFDSDHIFAFDMSPENRLLISRGNWIKDVVLIKKVTEGAGRTTATAN